VRVLITAGPTREFLDDVRFLSNPSTGAMGFACARAAAKAGHQVTLVSGPTPLEDPRGIRVVRVVSAIEMRDAAMKAFKFADAVIAAAAVSDWRPARRVNGKVKKGKALQTLALLPTPDILAEMGKDKGKRLLVGFALESENALRHGWEKLKAKNLDHVVVNSPATFGSDKVDATLLHASGAEEPMPGVTKDQLAGRIVQLLEKAEST